MPCCTMMKVMEETGVVLIKLPRTPPSPPPTLFTHLFLSVRSSVRTEYGTTYGSITSISSELHFEPFKERTSLQPFFGLSHSYC